MIGDFWFWVVIAGPVIVTVAFLYFCLVLVVLAIGIIGPHSSPRAEMEKLAALTSAVVRWWRA